jgi:hypothetical protein
MNAGLLLNLAPTRTLAVEDTNHTSAFVHIPDLE